MKIYENRRTIVIPSDNEKEFLRQTYWRKLEEYLYKKYGNLKTSEQTQVKSIFSDALVYFIRLLEDELSKEKNFSFFYYVMYLHDESLILIQNLNAGDYSLQFISSSQLSYYRRVLKLILEYGCLIHMKNDIPVSQHVFNQIDKRLPSLIYLGEFIYDFAGVFSMENMINDYFVVEIRQDYFDYKAQYHYSFVYDKLMPILNKYNNDAIIESSAEEELLQNIKIGFKLDFVKIIEVLINIQSYNNPKHPEYIIMEIKHILALTKRLYKDSPNYESFWSGLIINDSNRISTFTNVTTPRNNVRFLYRPILIYTIDKKKYAVTSFYKIEESLYVLSTNALHWGKLSTEWLSSSIIKRFMNLKRDIHENILITAVEEKIKHKNMIYDTSIKTFKQKNNSNINIISKCGEIDLIIINDNLKIIMVVEMKYNMAAYDNMTYNTDYSNFKKSYEKQLEKKVSWVLVNKPVLEEHFDIIRGEKSDIKDYRVEGFFFINHSTFYMLNSSYKTITLSELSNLLDGNWGVVFEDPDTNNRIYHPFFNGPQF